jgi:hypothetical protein
MFALPVATLAGKELRLRVWFAETQQDASRGLFRQLEPDLEFSSVPYAFEALVSEDARTLEGQSAAKFASATHQHAAGDITSGLLSAARLPTLTDALIPDSITLSSLTQISNRSHKSLTDVGTRTHAEIDAHIAATTNVHGLTYTAEGSGGGLDADQIDGFHASSTAAANTLLSLDANSKLPASITATQTRSMASMAANFSAAMSAEPSRPVPSASAMVRRSPWTRARRGAGIAFCR